MGQNSIPDQVSVGSLRVFEHGQYLGVKSVPKVFGQIQYLGTGFPPRSGMNLYETQRRGRELRARTGGVSARETSCARCAWL